MVAQGFAAGTVAVHYLVLAYMVFGGFIAWRWLWTIAVHVVAVGWAAFILIFPVRCPLTALDGYLRQRGGLPPLCGGFIDTYVSGVLYPPAYERLAQALAAAVVLVSWCGCYVHHRQQRGGRVGGIMPE